MKFWRQLRWRILATQIVVVIVGVIVLAWVADAVAVRSFTTEFEPFLVSRLPGLSAEVARQVSIELQDNFHQAVAQALLVAALAATVAGVVTGLLLTRDILRPLREIGYSSQRIAAGHYDERVSLPASDELAAVATSFNRMAEALAQVEQQRVVLIGNVAHELRTPLAGLEGYLEGMVDGVFPCDVETLNALQREVRRLHRLVNDLQALSRVEAGQVPLQLTVFDLVAVIRQVVMQLQPQVIAQGLDLVLDGPDLPLGVYADVDRTAQVLLNLIGNAIRYTPEAGRIDVRLVATEPLARVEIVDSGIGIAAEALPYIFERFYRVDRSRARSSGGSGIGLTIARHLVWAMGGDLTAASAGPGQGSTFCFSLPRAGGEVGAKQNM